MTDVTREFDIYFDDLKEEVQKQLLEYYEIQDVKKETNWDIEPLAIFVNDIDENNEGWYDEWGH